VFGKIDPEEEPSRYASFVARVLEEALQQESDPGCRLRLCNQLIEQISAQQELAFLKTRRLVGVEKPMLLEITPTNYTVPGMPRPETPLAESSLFTGSPSDPQLVHELLQEIRTADAVDVLVSFIKYSGLRLLMPGFEDLTRRNVRVRVITTSYMGASDADAIEWLARQPNVEVRVCYHSAFYLSRPCAMRFVRGRMADYDDLGAHLCDARGAVRGWKGWRLTRR
jgi:hypothetical protein